jgi:hypothetical protein
MPSNIRPHIVLSIITLILAALLLGLMLYTQLAPPAIITSPKGGFSPGSYQARVASHTSDQAGAVILQL